MSERVRRLHVDVSGHARRMPIVGKRWGMRVQPAGHAPGVPPKLRHLQAAVRGPQRELPAVGTRRAVHRAPRGVRRMPARVRTVR